MKPPRSLDYAVLTFFAVWGLSGTSQNCGRGAEQTIQLRPGWNAVYLEVQPETRDCNSVFADLPVESVWMWIPPTASELYMNTPVSPDSLVPSDQWHAYFPNEPRISNLFTVIGGKAYLIKASGDEVVPWVVKGSPRLPKVNWLPKGYNLVGLPIDPENTEALFGQLFLGSEAHVDREGDFHQPLYALAEVEGKSVWKRIDGLAPMESGTAYWMYAETHSDFVGPTSVDIAQRDILDFGSALEEDTLEIRNVGQADAEVMITVLDEYVGEENRPLQYYREDPNSGGYWEGLPDEGIASAMSPGELYAMRLGIDRSRIAGGVDYAAVLQIRSQGMRLRVQVTASKPRPTNLELWTGTASIQSVSRPVSRDPNQVLPASSSQFDLRLIVLRDRQQPEQEVYYLLDQAIGVWTQQDGADLEGVSPGVASTSERGRLLLFTDDQALSEYLEASESTQGLTGFRITSAAFAIPRPTEATVSGNFDNPDPTCTLEFSTRVEWSDPLNPFKHKYHPDHDGDDSRERFRVGRNITLKLSESKGNKRMGSYFEELTDLMGSDTAIYVEGSLVLRKVADPNEYLF